MKTQIEQMQLAFRHESHANRDMMEMLRGVPEDARSDPRHHRAKKIAAHIATCRQVFLDVITKQREGFPDMFPEPPGLDELDRQFAALESAWEAFFAKLTEAELSSSFEFEDNGTRWRFEVEPQLFQLIGHAAYHRGQVVLLVDQLGGETVDTDYVDWYCGEFPNTWGEIS